MFSGERRSADVVEAERRRVERAPGSGAVTLMTAPTLLPELPPLPRRPDPTAWVRDSLARLPEDPGAALVCRALEARRDRTVSIEPPRPAVDPAPALEYIDRHIATIAEWIDGVLALLSLVGDRPPDAPAVCPQAVGPVGRGPS